MKARIQKISRYAPSIFQGKLDLGARRRGFSLTAEHPAEGLIFCVLVASVIVLAVVYSYLVSATIINVMARREALTQSSNLATAVSKLEHEYFAIAQDIGPEDGARLGLAPVSKTYYMHRPRNLSAGNPTPDNEI